MFSPPMVRAIQAGRKTQTRRLLKGSTEHRGPYTPAYLEAHRGAPGWASICPHGKTGDRLWLREAMRFSDDGIHYVADDVLVGSVVRIPDNARAFANPYRPAMLMPRWACRTMLEITEVRVQRLQEISEEDALAEGVQFDDIERAYHVGGEHGPCNSARDSYACLWEAINGKGSWAANPWIWCVSFRRIDQQRPAA